MKFWTWNSLINGVRKGTGLPFDTVADYLTDNKPYRRYILDSLEQGNGRHQYKYQLTCPIEEVRKFLLCENARRRLEHE
ncbi:hypothetical protein LCGC14_1078350 [marine sediment metagenome]|uniref:Uncharacterized protein n=1 Tax=marine sediment metagenome TaxID=412755 RepID=A0A0F9MKW6_9ZZZZ